MTGSTIDVVTPDGAADCYLARPGDDGKHPAVLFMIDAIGLRPRIEEMADRIAAAGHVVPTPNVFYRAEVLPADAGNSPTVCHCSDPNGFGLIIKTEDCRD